jgi:hypothetical protein
MERRKPARASMPVKMPSHEMEVIRSREIKWFHGTCTVIQRQEETRERKRILHRLIWVVQKPCTWAKAIMLLLR